MKPIAPDEVVAAKGALPQRALICDAQAAGKAEALFGHMRQEGGLPLRARIGVNTCAYPTLNPDVLMMDPAED